MKFRLFSQRNPREPAIHPETKTVLMRPMFRRLFGITCIAGPTLYVGVSIFGGLYTTLISLAAFGMWVLAHEPAEMD